MKDTAFKCLRNRFLRLQFIMLFVSILTSVSSLYAQEELIKGIVKETNGEPLIGVSVVVKGTTIGTTTDFDGQYSLKVPADAQLTFSYLGMLSETVDVKGRTVINITLKSSSQDLEEVVVVGYGTQKKKDLTSSISTINSDAIANQPTTNALSAIQGRIAGVQVSNSGAPDSSPSIRIRGTGSANNSSPLYVVDGMIVDNISYLGPNDIESMSVLKDASAAAIYGVRAANGVIMVTTKQGSKDGSVKVLVNAYMGIKSASNVLPMVNTSEFVTLYNEALDFNGDTQTKHLTIDQFRYNTNWFNEVLSTRITNNEDVSIQGGTDKSTYNVGISHAQDNGLVNDDNYQKLGLRANYNFTLNKYVKAGLNMVVSSTKANPAPGNVLSKAFQALPMLGVKDENGEFCDPAMIDGFGAPDNNSNPMALLHYNHAWKNNLRAIMNAYVDVTFLKDFNFRTTLGLNPSMGKVVNYAPKYSLGSSTQGNSQNRLTKSTYNNLNTSWDNILTYEKTINRDHNLKVMAGYSYCEITTDNLSVVADDIVDLPEINQSFLFLTLGKGPKYAVTASDGGSKTVQIGYMGRLNYDYKHRYLLNVTMRADASSKFPSHNRWGYFPSVGLGWVLSEEEFMKDFSAIDFLKVRAGWGLLGNGNIPSNLYQFTTSNGTPVIFGPSQNGGEGQISNAVTITNSFNPDLRWEVVDETNIGVDATWLSNRLSTSLDWYYKQTKDAIFSATSIGSSGLNSSGVWGNYATILNTGFEFDIAWKDKIGEVNYSVQFNGNYNKNEVTKINAAGASYLDKKDDVNNIGPLTRTQVGRPVGEFFGYKAIGVFQNQAEIDQYPHLAGSKPGHLKFEDVNKDGVLDALDRTAIFIS